MEKEKVIFRIHYIPKEQGWRDGYCPKCGALLEHKYNPQYCGNCGQEVKWE